MPETPLTQKTIEKTFNDLSAISADITLQYFRSTMDVSNKLEEGFDPVTIADEKTEIEIRKYLTQHFPDHGISGEELAAYNPDANFQWIIDPVDGTRAFISGLPSWGTLVCLSKNHTPIAGMMFQPFTGELYYTSGGQSFLTRHGRINPLQTSTTKTLSNAILMTTGPDFFNESQKLQFDNVCENTKLTRYGFDCYAYAMLASGHIDLIVEANLKAFDIAALIPIVENAGGVIRTWDNQCASSGGNILAAANQSLFDQAIHLLN